MIEDHFSLAGGLNASFISNAPTALSEMARLHLKAHLPGIQAIEAPSQVPEIIIHHTEADEVSLVQNESHVHLHDRWGATISPDFSHLIYGAARRAWLSKNIYPVHAACVGNDEDGYILLVGHAGVGKTSITLQSALGSDLKVFSGDKTLIQITDEGGMEAISGTHALTIRLEDRSRWPTMEGRGVSNSDRYMFELNPDQYSSQSTVKIKAIVLPQLNDGVTKCQKLSSLSALHTLYSYFLDEGRSDIILAGGKALFDGVVDVGVRQKLTRDLSESLKSIPTFNIVAPLKSVINLIETIDGTPPPGLNAIDPNLVIAARPTGKGYTP